MKNLFNNTAKNSLWIKETLSAAVFFLAALAVLSSIRVFFFYWYKTDESFAGNFFDALVMGLRLDARWLGQGILLSWLIWILSAFLVKLRIVAKVLAVIVLALFVLADLVNFGFYGFYGTPINSIVFGLAQDDTKAILVTLWRDWPFITYCVLWVLLTAIPCVLFRLFKKGISEEEQPERVRNQWIKIAALIVVFTCALAVMSRGSFGTFPLRQQDLIVGTNEFINATIPNGFSALYEANKSRKALELKGGAIAGLKKFGFASEAEALSVLKSYRGNIPQEVAPNKKRHVVLAIMESMGIDQFDTDSPTNNTLGSLREELKDAVVFRKAVSVNHGTFPSLEGLLFDTPLTPLTQSKYGHQQIATSKALAFKEAGYKTVYLTSGTEKWREIDANFPIQGVDRILGAAAIKEKYPQAEFGTWGVGDAWTFKFASDLLSEADKKNEKLFLVILSATNHPPHRIPDGAVIEPVNPNELPAYIKDDRNSETVRLMMQTYQYACDSLGQFIRSLRDKKLIDNTLIAATGDHSARFIFESTGVWHRQFGVPVIFWVPQEIRGSSPINVNRWVGHRDIFPTLEALSLGATPKLWEGRNLFGTERFDGVLDFYGIGKDGFAIGSDGLVAFDAANARCFKWSEDQKLLEPSKCEEDLDRLKKAMLSQRALTDFAVRASVLGQ